MLPNLENEKKKTTKLDPHDLEMETKYIMNLFRSSTRGLELKETIDHYVET